MKKSLAKSMINSNFFENAMTLFEYGKLYYEKKNITRTIQFCNRSLDIAKQYNFVQIISDNYELLSDAYKAQGDYQKAYEYYTRFKQIQDTIYNIETNKQVIEIEEKYKAVENKKEISALKNETSIRELQLQNNKYLMYSVIFISILVIIIVIIFISTRAKSETTRKLHLQTIEIEENEKKRVAHDLHDDLSPYLSSILTFIGAVIHETHDPGQLSILQRVEKLIETSIDTNRTIFTNITPPLLNKFGFFAAIQSFCDLVNNSNDLKVILKIEGIERKFDSTVEIMLYRVITELINNSIKHANATVINLELMIREKFMTIFFEDDGIGFDFSKTIKNPAAGLGINNIISRINLIKGKCAFNAKPGKGTKVKIEINLNN